MRSEKIENTAILRTIASRGALNFATKRILKDIKEFHDNQIPTVNVSAYPLPNSLFIWHANILAPKDTIYSGMMVHLELKLPPNYPLSPPEVNLLSGEFTHPNIFSGNICLDILEQNKPNNRSNRDSQDTIGWVPSYTIQSVLIQLQSFMYEGHYHLHKNMTQSMQREIREEIEESNSYVCESKECKHRGKLSPWPAVIKPSEFKISKEFKTDMEGEVSLHQSNLKCYYSKEEYSDAQLGVGLNVKRVALSGEVQFCKPVNDLISLRSYRKDGLRIDSMNNRFDLWMPLFMSKKQEGMTLELGKRQISQVCRNTSTQFSYEMAISVFGSSMLSLFVDFAKKTEHPSIIKIQQLVNIHSTFLLFVKKFPKILEKVDQEIEEFISNKDSRVKSQTPNIGLLLIYCLISSKYSFNDLKEPYFEESLDRQVLWMLRKVPELENEGQVIEENRLKVTFNCSLESYLINSLIYIYEKNIKENYGNYTNLFVYLENKSNKLPESIENSLQSKFKRVLEDLDSYHKYFTLVGLPSKSNTEINEMLKTSIKNSSNKRYHGEIDDLINLKSEKNQAMSYHHRTHTIIDFIDKEEKAIKKATEEQWKQRCRERWNLVKAVTDLDLEGRNTPSSIAGFSDTLHRSVNSVPSFTIDQQQIYTQKALKHFNTSRYIDTIVVDYPMEKYLWQDLYVKLDFEEFLSLFDSHQDFKLLYFILDIIAPKLRTLLLLVIKPTNLKSNFYYICSILSRLPNLKVLKVRSSAYGNDVSYKFVTNLCKGIKNLNSKNTKLKKIVIQDLRLLITERQEITKANNALRQMIPCNSELLSLSLINTNISNLLDFRLLGSILSQNSKIESLKLSKSLQYQEQVDSLADGLMRAKKLKQIQISNIKQFINYSSLVYNLAFSPQLECIMLKDIQSVVHPKELGEKIIKLLEISGSIKHLICESVTPLINSLGSKFGIALGGNRTIETLSLNKMMYEGKSKFPKSLAQAIVINAWRGGKLKNLHLSKVFIKFGLEDFFDNLNVTYEQIETEFGDIDNSDAPNFDKNKLIFKNNIEILDLGFCNLPIKIQSDRSIGTKDISDLTSSCNRRLFTCMTKLTHLNLEGIKITKFFIEMMEALLEGGEIKPSTLQVGEPSKVIGSKIEILNLSNSKMVKGSEKSLKNGLARLTALHTLIFNGCKYGVSGAIHLNPLISQLQSLRHLEMFNCQIGIEGARNLAKQLQEGGSSLEYLNIGFNNIKDGGLIEILGSIVDEQSSVLSGLGLRLSNITQKGVNAIFEKIENCKNKSKLTKFLLNKNQITDINLSNIHERYQKLRKSHSLYFDIFDKMTLIEKKKLNRTIWVSCQKRDQIKQILRHFNQKGAGIILNTRDSKMKTNGSKQKSQMKTKFNFFIEFADKSSANKAIILSKYFNTRSNRRSYQGCTIKKAGTSTYSEYSLRNYDSVSDVINSRDTRRRMMDHMT